MAITLPEINIWDMTSTNIVLTWPAVNRSDTLYYKLYGCATYSGAYTLVQDKISNIADARSPGSVMVILTRAALSIASDQPYFFKITSVNFSAVESSIGSSNFVSVDASGVYRARVQDDRNPVYKNFNLSIPNGTTAQLVDVKRVLGREANFVEITTDNAIKVQFNSNTNDLRAVTATVPFESASNGTLVVTSIYVSNTSGSTATVQIFVSGN